MNKFRSVCPGRPNLLLKRELGNLSCVRFTMTTIRLLIAALTLFAHSQVFPQAFKHAWPDTNFDLLNIDLKEIMSGGPPKDGIPPIDAPKFDSISEAGTWVNEDEPVISVEINGHARAYPLQVMTWHEIVNDELAGSPVSVTFCPLCNASIVFDRRVGDRILDFGTTGLLRKSDLVMYDRQTESWWQQFSGTGIVGDYTDFELKRVPSAIVSFSEFSKAYPDGQVLNRDTGLRRPYGENPYPGYDNINSSPFLFRGKVDSRLPAMERVLGIHHGKAQKIYPFTVFDSQPLIQDEVGGLEILAYADSEVLSALDARDIASARKVHQVTAFQRTVDGTNSMQFEVRDGHLIDLGTGSIWNSMGQSIQGPLKGKQLMPVDSGVHFAFAWLAFNPDTEIYDQ